MKKPFVTTVTFLLMSMMVFASASTPPMEASDDGFPMFAPEELDELLGPVALYPDALVALILPASTVPTDIVRAARYLETNPDLDKVESMPWDESVIALVHYPAVIHELNENLEWTILVGQAFALQPADVMRSIQRLRSTADTLGHLSNTEQQQIVREGEVIRIIPANPEVIYVPYYETRIVYRDRWVGPPSIHFRHYYPVSSWLYFDLDWMSWHVAVVHPTWRHAWYVHRPWRAPYYRHRDPYWRSDRFRVWTPPRRDWRRSYQRHYRSDRAPVGNYRRYDPARPVYRSAPRPPSYRHTPRPPTGRSVAPPPPHRRLGESMRNSRPPAQRYGTRDTRTRWDTRDTRTRWDNSTPRNSTQSSRDSWRSRESSERPPRETWRPRDAATQSNSRDSSLRPPDARQGSGIDRHNPPNRPNIGRSASSVSRPPTPRQESRPPARETIRESRPQSPSQSPSSSSRRTEGDGPRRSHSR